MTQLLNASYSYIEKLFESTFNDDEIQIMKEHQNGSIYISIKNKDKSEWQRQEIYWAKQILVLKIYIRQSKIDKTN